MTGIVMPALEIRELRPSLLTRYSTQWDGKHCKLGARHVRSKERHWAWSLETSSSVERVPYRVRKVCFAQTCNGDKHQVVEGQSTESKLFCLNWGRKRERSGWGKDKGWWCWTELWRMTSTIWKWQKTQQEDLKTHCFEEQWVTYFWRKVEHTLMSNQKYGSWSHTFLILFTNFFLYVSDKNV